MRFSRHVTLIVAVAAICGVAAPASASADYTSAVLEDGPLAYYRLNETGGLTAADSSGHDVAGAFSATGVNLSEPAAFPGSGSAVRLSGAGTVQANLAPHAQTVSFWVKPSVRTQQTLVQHGDPKGDGWRVAIADKAPRGGKRKLFFESRGKSVTSRLVLASGTWTMVSVTWDASKVSFYLNGGAITKVVNAPAGWSAGPSAGGTLKIGPGAGAGGTSFDEVALFPRVLSKTELAAQHAATALPTVVSAPVLSPLTGVQVGDRLTVTPGIYSNGTNAGREWQRCDEEDVCTTIASATGTTYVATAADLGFALQVRETVTNAQGPVTATSHATDAVLAADPVLPEVVNAPVVNPHTGVRVGQELTVTEGTYSRNGAVTGHEWQRCDTDDVCETIAGATGTTYVATADDLDFTLRVEETATNADGSRSVTSNATDPVAPALPTALSAPVLSPLTGVRVGHRLTLVPGSFLNATGFSREWQRCDSVPVCTPIAGVTGTSYVVTAADLGFKVQVVETATNDDGEPASARSGATDAVLPAQQVDPGPGTRGGGAGAGNGGSGSGGGTAGPGTGLTGGSGTAASGANGAPTITCSGARRLAPSRGRSARIGGVKVTLKLNRGKREVSVIAKRGTVRKVAFKLDGRGVHAARKRPRSLVIRRTWMKPGVHRLTANVKTSQGKSRTLRMKLMVRAC